MSSNASSSPPSAELSLQAQPFADDLIDVAAVNADVSDVLAARIEAVVAAARAADTRVDAHARAADTRTPMRGRLTPALMPMRRRLTPA